MRIPRLRGPSRAVAVALLAFAAGVLTGRATGQGKPRMWADTVLDVVTEALPATARVRANVDHWDPGAETGRHTHPGPVVFVMLEGELEELFPDGRTRTLKAGQAQWKPPGIDHNVRNRSRAPARALAVHLDPVR
jgi:quercetin dioxygenase-like cupin family protein